MTAHHSGSLTLRDRRNAATRRLIAMFATTTFLLLGCAATPEAPTSTEAAQLGDGWTQCADPRPRVCTMEYMPVCARVASADEKTYPSQCNACADVAVSAWRTDPCEDN